MVKVLILTKKMHSKIDQIHLMLIYMQKEKSVFAQACTCKWQLFCKPKNHFVLCFLCFFFFSECVCECRGRLASSSLLSDEVLFLFFSFFFFFSFFAFFSCRKNAKRRHELLNERQIKTSAVVNCCQSWQKEQGYTTTCRQHGIWCNHFAVQGVCLYLFTFLGLWLGLLTGLWRLLLLFFWQ